MKNLIQWRNKTRKTAPVIWDEDWFGRIWGNPLRGLFPAFPKSFSLQMPSVEVSDDKSEVTVRAEVPGLTEKDIDLTWHDGVLRIRGEKKMEKEDKKRNRFYSECSYGMFSRDIPLSESVNWKNARAKYRHGILTVKLPKTESNRKAIEIKVN